MHGLILVYFAAGALALRLLVRLFPTTISPLRSIPGPLVARFSKLWYFNRVNHGQFQYDNIALHRKYGPLVRVAPDHYSIDDPSAMKLIYGIGTKFAKGDWYYGGQHPDSDRFTIFSDRDIQRHARERRKFNAMYSTSTLLSYESFVDRCTDLFSQRLTEHAQLGRSMNMGHWFQCYAFDVIACITYGDRFGFLDEGKDINGAIGQLWKVMKYSTLIGIYSRLHPILFPWTSKMPWTGASGRLFVMSFVQQQIDKRKAERKRRDMEKGEARAKQAAEDGTPEDSLEKIMNAHEENPEKITTYDIFAMGQSNIIAGSDTTAISLSGILYYLLQTPHTLETLRAEIQQAEAKGECGNPKVTFKQTLAMPYFQAVMKEALRLHPATGLPLWRKVPAGGAHISGHFFPEGTTIGVNTWTAHYNHDIFGLDAAEFRPERWLDSSPDVLKKMDAYYMPFGLGSRTCMGRHISELEMSKLIPRLVRDFDFELVRPGEHWKMENYWFVKPTDFEVRVSLRKGM